ncbi:MAG: heat-inducible transcriptional repressor HrcA [Anaerotardibacter sp.]
MLSDRRHIVLRALIEEYIKYAVPVGSRTLVDRYNLGFSSATIRNELSYLENQGYLSQPHTSAGRIPTDFGYRAFVDELLASLPETNERIDEISRLRQTALEIDDLIEQTKQALMSFTDCLSLIIPPRLISLDVLKVSLVALTPSRVLMVIISKDGQVFDRHIELPQRYSDVEIVKAESILNEVFAQQTLNKDTFPVLQRRIENNELYRLLVKEMIKALEEKAQHHIQPSGVSNLLHKPEFQDSSRILPVLEQLEQDTILMEVMDEAIKSDAPVVRIGSENGAEALMGVSLIASRFGVDDNMGLIAIVGPTRMNYRQVLKAVRAAKDVLPHDE